MDLNFFETGPADTIGSGGNRLSNTDGSFFKAGKTVPKGTGFCKMRIDNLKYASENILLDDANHPSQFSSPSWLKPVQDALGSGRTGGAWRFSSLQGGILLVPKKPTP